MRALPLKYRLRAWWEGYDLSSLRQRANGTTSTAADDDMDDRRRRGAERSFATPNARPAATAIPTPAEATGWTPSMLAAGQIVWGENSLSPRGDSRLQMLTARAGLGQKSRIIHLGAELGGTASLLERGLGCKVIAVETLAEFVAAANGRVQQLEPTDGPTLSKSDFILVDGLAERSEPLSKILRSQSAGLVAGGMLVLRSLVLVDERAAGSSRYRSWVNAEPVRPRLRSSDELTRIMQEARLNVIASTSIADEYAAEVEQSWGDALDRIRALHRDPAGRVLIPTLLSECERWLKRIELVREGVLGVRLITAARRDRSRHI